MDISRLRQRFDLEHKLTFTSQDIIFDITCPGIDCYYLREIDPTGKIIKSERINERDINPLIEKFIS